jgi:Na+-translocating ferredoxin:NAD+ oxidoreductase RnfG subunit
MRDFIQRFTAPAAIIVGAGAVPCLAATYLSTEEACKLCFPSAGRFTREDVALTPDQVKAVEKEGGVKVKRPGIKAWKAFDGPKFLGWYLEDEVNGKHDIITWGMGMAPDGAVLRIEILAYNETYGYEVREEKWRAQFIGKKPGAPVTLNEDVKNISGATISCRRITEGVKRLLAVYAVALRH